jgi:hypothetical protein
MWQLLPEANGQDRAANAQAVKTLLEGLPTLIPEIKSLTVGINHPGVPGNHDLVLDTLFDDLAALQRYQEHPEHLKVGAFIAGVRSSRACVDWEVG